MAVIDGATGPAARSGPGRGSAKSLRIAVLPIGARGGLRHGGATAHEHERHSLGLVAESDFWLIQFQQDGQWPFGILAACQKSSCFPAARQGC